MTFVVDVAIEEQRRQSQLPILRAALIDAETILRTLVMALRNALECSVTQPDLADLRLARETFNPEIVGAILHRCRFDQRTSFVDLLVGGAFEHRSWADVLSQLDA